MCDYLKRFLLVACLVMLMTGAASSATFMVMEGGTAPYFTNLDTALWTAETYGPGPHTIEVYPGNYTDANLVVPTNVIEIIGMADERNGVVFTAVNYQVDNFLDISASVGLTLTNMTVLEYSTALHGTGVDDVIVTDIEFGNNGVDFYTVPADEVGGAIILYDCDNGWFENLHIYDGERGLRLRGNPDYSDGNTIRNCLIEHNEQYAIGIGWNGGSNNTIDSNVVIGSEDFGIQIRGAGNSGNVIRDNVVDSCLWEGIVNNGATGGSIEGNTVSNCAFQIINPSGGNDHTGLTYAGIYREGTTTGGHVMNNTCFNNGDGVDGYGIMVDGGGINVHDNCLYGHPGIQGADNGDGSSWWHDNYYSGLSASTYLLDGAGNETDNSPVIADASANADPTTYDVFDLVDVTFDWDRPDCDPDFPGLAVYSFTVTWDPDVLELVPGSYDYDYTTLGDTAFYAPFGGVPANGTLIFEAANYLAPQHLDAMLAYAQFQMIGIGSTDITIASTYLDSTDTPIITGNTTLTLLGEDNTDPIMTVTPVGGPIHSWGSPTVYAPDVGNQLIVDISATDQYKIDHVWYQFDGLGWCGLAGGVDDVSYTNTGYHADYVGCPIPLTPVPGVDDGTVPHTLEVGVWDAGGNFHSQIYTFYIDWTVPVFTSWAMADPTCHVTAEYTNDLINDVTFVDDGTAHWVEWHDGGWTGVKLPYPQATFGPLTAGDGLKTHYAYLYDEFLNRCPWKMETINLDQTPGTPSGLTINGGAAKTAVLTVAVSATAWSTATGSLVYMLTEDINDITCDATGWEDIVAPYVYDFDLIDEERSHTIYRATKDRAGNISVIDDASIIYDKTEPVFLTFDINGGDACSDDALATVVDVTWDDVAFPDATTIYLSLDNVTFTSFAVTGAGTQQIAYSMLPAWTGTDGQYFVYGYIEDDIANASAVVSDDIILDGSDPTVSGLVLDGGATWSQDPIVDVDFVAPMSADIDEIQMGEVTLTYTETQVYATGTNTYDFGSGVAQNVWVTLYAEGYDCSDRATGEVTDAIAFDFIDPDLSAVTIDGVTDGSTMDLTVDVDFTYVEVSRSKVYISETADMLTNTVELTWIASGPYVFTMSAGEGLRTLYVQLKDASGRLSLVESASIWVDTELPTGSITLQQNPTINPMALPGYTNSTTIEIVGITYPGDVDSMMFSNGGSPYARMLAASTYTPHVLTSGDGVKTVEYWFRDTVGNYGGPYTATIELITSSPSAPVVSASPSGSVAITIADNPAHQGYTFRYNATYDYPVYADGAAPAPAIDEGHAGYFVPGDFIFDEYPSMDILTFTFWSYDNAGNMSTLTDTCISTNYRPGDFDGDGTFTFVEFGDIAASYWLCDGDPGFCTPCDFGPLGANNEPVPDGCVGFDELSIFAYNYSLYGDFGTPKLIPSLPLAINIEMPYMKAGTVGSFAINMENASSVLAYHMVLDYDAAQFEVVLVEQGAMRGADGRSFFNNRVASSDIDISGAVFGDQFVGSEVAVVTVKAKQDGSFDISLADLTIRNFAFEVVDAEFSIAKSAMVPDAFGLAQNYPNPFNPATTISFSLPIATDYDLAIYNVTGQIVESFAGHAEAGIVQITWNASNLSSGVYFYKLETSMFSDTKKMVLLK